VDPEGSKLGTVKPKHHLGRKEVKRMKKSTDMLKAEAEHLRQLEAALAVRHTTVSALL